MAPWFIYRRCNHSLALGFLLLGLSFGLLVGMTRIMQEGTFFSDVLWVDGLVYITGEVLSWIFHFPTPQAKPLSNTKK